MVENGVDIIFFVQLDWNIGYCFIDIVNGDVVVVVICFVSGGVWWDGVDWCVVVVGGFVFQQVVLYYFQ